MEDLPAYLFPLVGDKDAAQIDSVVLAEVCQKLSVSAVEVGVAIDYLNVACLSDFNTDVSIASQYESDTLLNLAIIFKPPALCCPNTYAQGCKQTHAACSGSPVMLNGFACVAMQYPV